MLQVLIPLHQDQTATSFPLVISTGLKAKPTHEHINCLTTQYLVDDLTEIQQ